MNQYLNRRGRCANILCNCLGGNKLYGGKNFTVEGDTIIIRYFDGTVKKEKYIKTNLEPAIIEKIKREMDEEKAPAINTYNHLDDYHYEHKPKALSKVLVNPFKDLEINLFFML